MKCPKCNDQLSIKETEGHVGYACESCFGIWLPWKYLSGLSSSHEFDAKELIEKLNKSIKNNTEYNCPTCKTYIETAEINNIEIEWCNTCNGIWFDKNELSALITKHGETSATGKIASNVTDALMLIGSIISS